MATVLPSSPPPSSPPSASNSENSATRPTSSHTSTPPPPKPQAEGATDNGGLNVDEKKPELSEDFEYLDSMEYIEKFKKYEADYTRRLMAKYFSKKNLYGGNIFDENMTIGDEIIKSSRWPCTRSYADPVQGFEDQNSSSSAYSDETLTNISNGKHPVKKSG